MRAADLGGLDAPALSNAADDSIEMQRSIVLAHHPDARENLFSADDRYGPAEALRGNFAPEVKLDISRVVCGKLNLSCVQQKPRHAEAELPVQRVIRPARQDTHAPANLA